MFEFVLHPNCLFAHLNLLRVEQETTDHFNLEYWRGGNTQRFHDIILDYGGNGWGFGL